MHSRNRRCGILIGQGMPPEQAVKEIGMVVEGYYAAANARALAEKAGVEMPFTQAACHVLYEGRSAREAIAQARAAGVRVVLNTGRPIPEVLYFARAAGCDALNGCLGGAALVDRDSGQVLERRDIPQTSGRRALELCLGREIELMIFAGNEILLDPFSQSSLLRTYPFPAFHQNAVLTPDPLAYMAERGLPLTKLHGDWNRENYPLKELSGLEGIALTSSNDHDFEVTAAGVDKGFSLRWLAERYGVSLSECAAVGDSDNDLAMLRAAGLPIAMGNASQGVKDAAARIAPPCGEGGAAWAILSCLD